MSRNGNGIYSLPPGNPVVTGTTISSTWANNTLSDISTALTQSIASDGQTTPTANLPMGGFKHTGLGSGTARTESVNLGQVQDAVLNWIAAGGTSDAITATYSPPITALVDGQLCFVRAAYANATTTPTFAPSGLPAHTIVMYGGGALYVGSIKGAGHEMILRYNLANTRWELLNTNYEAAATFAGLVNLKSGADIASAATIDLTSATGNTVNITGTTATSALTMNDGQQMMLIAAAAWPLTYNATTMNINGGASYTCTAGDRIHAYKKGTVIYVDIVPARTQGTFSGSLVAGTSGTITMGNSQGTWSRIGDNIFFEGLFDVSSVSSPLGTLTLITDIPFSSANNNRNISSVSIRVNNVVGTAGLVWQGYVNKNTKDIIFDAYSQSTGTTGTNAASLVQTNTSFIISGQYRVN